MDRSPAPPGGVSADRFRRLALGVLMPGFNGSMGPGWLTRAIADGLGGVMLVAQNAPDLETTRALTGALHAAGPVLIDRKSTRLNSSHVSISYDVFRHI